MTMKRGIVSLQDQMGKLRIDALLLNTSEALLSLNLRYVTGFTGSEAAMLMTGTERHLFTDGRYKTQARQETAGFQIHVVRNKLAALTRALKDFGIRRLGIEASRASYDFVTGLVRLVPNLEVVPLKRTFLETLRIRKDQSEKSTIQKAASIASQACGEVLSAGLVGKRESDVAAQLEYLFRLKGAEAVAFNTIVASGERGALPHGKASDKVINNGELVVIDFGCRFNGYHSDETVTCITGKPSSEQVRMHMAVYDSHMRALEAVKPGVGVREMDSIARDAINRAGFGKYFLHGLGHGVGLEIHEPPYLSPRGSGVLKEGMVFTIEPGVYMEGLGGVRLESLVYLSADGPELLSEMPKTLIPVS
jgi:Xaa-Pro aminopeptidase